MNTYLGKCTEFACPWINQLGGCSLTACIRNYAVMMPSVSAGTIKLNQSDIDLLNEIAELRADRDNWKAEAIKVTAELGEMKIAEEFGEMCQQINEFGFHPSIATEDNIIDEAVRTMASYMAMIECIMRYRGLI